MLRSLFEYETDTNLEPVHAYPEERERLLSLSLKDIEFESKRPIILSRTKIDEPYFDLWVDALDRSKRFSVPSGGTSAERILTTLLESYESEIQIFKEAPLCRNSLYSVPRSTAPLDLLGSQSPQLIDFLSAVETTQLICVCAIQGGNSTLALQMLEFIYRFHATHSNDHFLTTSMVRIASVYLYHSILWYGLKERAFSHDQLSKLSEDMARVDLITESALAVEFETFQIAIPMCEIFKNATSPQMSKEDLIAFHMEAGSISKTLLGYFGVPEGMWELNQAHLARASLTEILLPLRQKDISSFFDPSELDSTSMYLENCYSLPMLRTMRKGAKKAASMSIDVEQAKIAVALERFHLAHNTYPKSLDKLVPRFLPHVAADPFSTGSPMSYFLDSSGRPVIYSIGPNGTDEQGRTHIRSKQNFHPTESKGDISWHYSKDLLIER